MTFWSAGDFGGRRGCQKRRSAGGGQRHAPPSSAPMRLSRSNHSAEPLSWLAGDRRAGVCTNLPENLGCPPPPTPRTGPGLALGSHATGRPAALVTATQAERSPEVKAPDPNAADAAATSSPPIGPTYTGEAGSPRRGQVLVEASAADLLRPSRARSLISLDGVPGPRDRLISRRCQRPALPAGEPDHRLQTAPTRYSTASLEAYGTLPARSRWRSAPGGFHPLVAGRGCAISLMVSAATSARPVAGASSPGR